MLSQRRWRRRRARSALTEHPSTTPRARRQQHPRRDRGLSAVTERDHGTVLLLFPAAVLCVMVLAAITIDLGLLQVRVQQLRSVAASAANDALGALDVDTLRDTGTISFDLAEARQIVADAVAAGPLPDASVDGVTITARPADRWEIAVTLSLVVEPVIAPAIGGRTGGWQPTVTEHALVAG